jgi:hypothetical protein
VNGIWVKPALAAAADAALDVELDADAEPEPEPEPLPATIEEKSTRLWLEAWASW